MDLDPRDSRADAHENPLAQYLTVPNGIGVVAAVQVLIGILFAYTAFGQYGTRAAAIHVASLCALGAMFLAIGIGFWQCRAWAWWTMAAVYAFLLVTTGADLVRGTGPDVAQQPVFLVVALAAESAVLVYIYRDFVVRFMSFRRPPSVVMRYSPIVAGVAVAVVAVFRRVKP